jgi:hypothetical protein
VKINVEEIKVNAYISRTLTQYYIVRFDSDL